MLRFAARPANRWNWFSFEEATPEHFAPPLGKLDAACREVGRDSDSLDRTLDILVAPTGEADTLSFSGQPVMGSADEIAAAPSALAKLGASEIYAWIWPPSPKTVEAMDPVIELVARGGGRRLGRLLHDGTSRCDTKCVTAEKHRICSFAWL